MRGAAGRESALVVDDIHLGLGYALAKEHEAGRLEVTFYLEMSWLYVLHGAPTTDWDAPTVDAREAAPYLDHLAEARAVFEAKGGASVERRSLAASPVPEVSPPSSPPETGNTGNLSGKDAGSKDLSTLTRTLTLTLTPTLTLSLT